MNNDRPALSGHDPHAEYSEKLELRRGELRRETVRSRRFWLLRRLDFALMVAAGVLAFDGDIRAFWVIPFPLAFIVLMALHQKVLDRIGRLERSVRFYERGLDRLDDRWAGTGSRGERYLDPGHPYAEDLDLFGRGSLFELLSTATTSGGEEKLAGWLLAPASIDEIRARQQAVAELRSKTGLHEDLYCIGEDVESGINTDSLKRWASAEPVFVSPLMPVVAGLLGAIAPVAVILWFGFGYRLTALAALIALTGFHAIHRAAVSKVVGSVEQPGRELQILARILRRIEEEPFASERLLSLRRNLEGGAAPPSVRISSLARIIQVLDSVRNQFFAPLAFLLALLPLLAFAIDRWRKNAGSDIPLWIDTVGEIEALCSIGGYAYEHPKDPFPEIVEEGPCFEGMRIGHPLIPESRCVRNDVGLGAESRLLVISGSNMSGKSTLMRTVGVNAILAFSGAPVRAGSLRISPLAVGASMHILDSLQAGSSRFYAEISRLRLILDLTSGDLPLLFLLDEILSGTNSHDRRIGAEAVVRTLVERGAVGMITTHDLALTHIAGTIGPAASNVHFEDRIEDGRIVFDYTMRPGVVERSNALELMRSVGLDVQGR